ncbi:2'-5' RNA ligase family protein [Haematomicrobium sanguinis]|uniref:2'-5' RNA ligase family protein n=1 Tax=Haematomicrobium sanguinis TaxID=479106 RepID=UPI000A0147D1|nr:2'-5' RNA ligase family protein [Haematomicrobium sanguinis]
MTPIASTSPTPSMDGAGSIGVIIEVPEPLRATIQRWRERYGKHDGVAPVPPHITLITGAQIHDWAQTISHIREVVASWGSFNVGLRGSATFRPVSPVVYLNITDGFAECESLHAALRTGPLGRELEFPYYPHVTIAHHVGDADHETLDAAQEKLADFDAEFKASTVGVYELNPDGGWNLREEIALGN